MNWLNEARTEHVCCFERHGQRRVLCPAFDSRPHASSVFRTVSASTRDVDTRDVDKDHPRIKPGQGLCSRQVIP